MTYRSYLLEPGLIRDAFRCGRCTSPELRFKYRNKIGSEIALEALRDYLKMHSRGADALWHFAKICRVSKIMRPYLKAATT